ncbi:putative Bug-like extracytoplasmic solute binding receptor, TTT family [Variovorax paradoxus B4]|uniref:Putative Bug-like extracytoplasmic solute binding receptor, TTT family n=1 Tax=Variovorax paradoxus B4 TaxID=1246301 RepID=T1X688_VARPD|nr:tripartite tricarboxylate transporter substrate binding protein [Variovorax paradoxus]AGU47665.1 putative Bug-like extracytoplasmic solute binding receptor, TTT family [Variovorax paradoxus B4]
MPSIPRRALPVLFFCAATAACLPALAADTAWPARPVRLVVPYAPGGTTDYAARQIAQKLTEQTGISFYVENKAGASGTIGSSLVAKSTPDGGTFLINDTTYAMLPHLIRKLPWEPADLVPVTTIVDAPLVLVVGANSPYKSLDALIGAARKNPDKLTFGSGGVGSSTHLGGELLKQNGKLALTHVPYKGAGEAMLGVVSGQVDVLVTAAPTAIPQVKGGKVRALLVTSPKRLAALPDAPTSAEAGLKEFTATNWFGIAAPKGTPQPVIDKLQAEVKKALASPDLVQRFAEQGASPGGLPSADFGKFVHSQTQTWGRVIKAAGVQPE